MIKNTTIALNGERHCMMTRFTLKHVKMKTNEAWAVSFSTCGCYWMQAEHSVKCGRKELGGG